MCIRIALLPRHCYEQYHDHNKLIFCPTVVARPSAKSCYSLVLDQICDKDARCIKHLTGSFRDGTQLNTRVDIRPIVSLGLRSITLIPVADHADQHTPLCLGRLQVAYKSRVLMRDHQLGPVSAQQRCQRVPVGIGGNRSRSSKHTDGVFC